MKSREVLLLLVVLLVCVQRSECGRCFAHFDVVSGECSEEIGEFETDVCCQNPNYGSQGEDGVCVYCGISTWSPWSEWSQCNSLCEGGVRTRSRKCHGFSQSECKDHTKTFEMEPCNGTCCTKNPGWDLWLPWSPCSVTCGVGVHRRVKSCPSSVECSVACHEPVEESEPCEDRSVCPVHGGWTSWSKWSRCSASCISGVTVPIRYATRSCSSPAPSTDALPHGNACAGASRKEQACSELPNCPVDGQWGAWSQPGPCSVTCGVGLKLSNRVCNNPAPKYGGKYCVGPSSQTSECNSICPVHGLLTGWSTWSECSSTCIREGQVPFRTQHRSCSNPAPSSTPPGQPCTGEPKKQGACEEIPHCAVDGQWGAWSPFTPCPVTCGVGLQRSVRHCDSPAPKHNGRLCPGVSQRTQICSTNVHCPVDGVWSEWSRWDKCTHPRRPNQNINCEDMVGQQYRDRTCVHQAHNGKLCPGSVISDAQLCYDVHNCYVSGNWEGWDPWSLCRPTCGTSAGRVRKRHCEPDYSKYRKSKGGQTVDAFHGRITLDCAPHKDGEFESQPCLNAPPCS